jgi:hypothetical protein
MKSKINKLIYIYEMIGGILGVGIAIIVFIKTIMDSKSLENYGIKSLIVIFILALYVLSFIGGFLLWKGKENGMVISIIVQIFQIPYIITSNCIYVFISGLQLGASISIPTNILRITGLFAYGSSFDMYFGNSVKYTVIGMNFIPIIVIYYIIKIKRIQSSNKSKEENEGIDDVSNTLNRLL